MEKNYKELIDLYKKKITGELTDSDICEYTLSISKQIDACIVDGKNTEELEELKEEAYWIVKH